MTVGGEAGSERVLPWPLRRFRSPLGHDRWFVAACLLYIAIAIASVVAGRWFGIATGLVIFYWLGGIRHIVQRFRDGYRGP